jgi:hypothetical protein
MVEPEDPDAEPPVDLWDSAEADDPPAAPGLGPLGQLLSAVLTVGALILLFLGGALVVGWLL